MATSRRDSIGIPGLAPGQCSGKSDQVGERSISDRHLIAEAHVEGGDAGLFIAPPASTLTFEFGAEHTSQPRALGPEQTVGACEVFKRWNFLDLGQACTTFDLGKVLENTGEISSQGDYRQPKKKVKPKSRQVPASSLPGLTKHACSSSVRTQASSINQIVHDTVLPLSFFLLKTEDRLRKLSISQVLNRKRKAVVASVSWTS